MMESRAKEHYTEPFIQGCLSDEDADPQTSGRGALRRGRVVDMTSPQARQLDLARAGKVAKADAFAAKVRPDIQALRDEGVSLRAIAISLNKRGIQTPRGGTWTATAVKRALARTVAKPELTIREARA